MKLPEWTHPKVRVTLNVTLPRVLAEIKTRLDAGERLTQGKCLEMPGYHAVRRLYPHAAIVDMALGRIPVRVPEDLR